MALFPGTPKLESRNCPEIIPGLWELITPDCRVGSRQGLNQSCSPRRDLFSDVSHSQIGCREEVDSRLLVVGSQTACLTPGLSFAHNLGCRYPNGQCEAIFDIYASRPFQWHQERLNASSFGPFCRTLNIRESRRTPSPQLLGVLGFTPTLGQSGVATLKDLGGPGKFDMTRNAEFRKAQIMDIVLWKWFFVDLSFRAPNSKEEENSKENSPIEAKKKSLLPKIGAQSQGAPTDADESLNMMHLIGEIIHP